jgi:hypothetical protein
VAGLIGAIAVAAAVVSAFANPFRHDINDLAWMAGCWERVNGDRIVEEQWLAPRGGMMLGMGRTVRAGKVVEYESTRIEQRGDSVIFFAQPSGQAASFFPAIAVSAKEVIFEDLNHDFPQRVIYRNGGDSLLASVEGMRNGNLARNAFPMVRARCEGNPGTRPGVRSE